MPRHVDSIKCGSCKGRHGTVAQVGLCYARKWDAKALEMQQDAEAKAEAAAELRNEQWFEERGGAIDDPRERELWAMEDMRAEAIIAARKDATLELLARWRAAHPGRQLNGYACTPYSRCNCPTSYSRCSAFAVLERFEAANPVQLPEHFHPGDYYGCRDAHLDEGNRAHLDTKPAAAFQARSFHLRGTDRARPW